MPEGRSRGRRGHGGNDRGNSRRRHGPPVEIRPALPVDDLPLDDVYASPAEGEPGAEGSVDLNSLYKMGNQQVADAAKQLAIEGATSMRKQDLLFEIMKAQSEKSGLVFAGMERLSGNDDQ